MIWIKILTLCELLLCLVENTQNRSSAQQNSSAKMTSTLPVIIWWTGRLFPHWNSDEVVISCGLGNCLTTNSRRYYTEAKHEDDLPELLTLLFYGTDLEVEDLPLNFRWCPNVLWALLHEESPMNNYVFSHEPMMELFNYTATFSRYSDYPLTTLFLPSCEYLVEREPVPLNIKNKFRHDHHAAPILYVQSHCDVPSDRDRYVAELAWYIPIDCFGKCLHNKDLPAGLDNQEKFNDIQFYDFIANYKFHLAFENALCNDYITEKLFRALHVGSVPIYRGSSTVTDWVTSRTSVILVDDFESPQEIAEFIAHVDGNDTLYEKYMEFKNPNNARKESPLMQHLRSRPWGVDDDKKLDFIQGFECFVCDRMIEMQQQQEVPNGNRTTYHPKTANNTHMGCPPPKPSSQLGSSEYQQSIEMKDWIDSYWYGMDIAKALRQMVSMKETESSKVHFYATSTAIRDEL